jgi:hypothetical protein
MPIIESAYRFSEYLDRQARVQKEKRKEKFLSILPTYLEQTVSGIQDEESLYATLPRLSAEMYRYGSDVGSQATQILGTLAQSKLRELGEKRQKSETESQIALGMEAYKDIPIDVGGKVGTISDLLGSLEGHDRTMVAKNLPSIVGAKALKQTGMVESTGDGTFFNQYHVQPSTGKVIQGTRFAVDTKNKTMDDLSKEGNEELPLAPEVVDYMTKQKEDEDKFNRRLKAQESSQLRTFANQLAMQETREQARIERELYIGDDGVPVYPRYEETSQGKVLRFKVVNDKKYKDLFNVGLSDPGNKEARERILKEPDLINYTGGTPQSISNYVKSQQITPATLDQVHQGARRMLMGDILPKMRSYFGDDFDKEVKITDPVTGSSFYDTEKIKAKIAEKVKQGGGIFKTGKSLEDAVPGAAERLSTGDFNSDQIDMIKERGYIDEGTANMFKLWKEYLDRMETYYRGEAIHAGKLEGQVGSKPSREQWWKNER